jgi:lipoprotein-anchoring transpeptidase ErfK/SrfK
MKALARGPRRRSRTAAACAVLAVIAAVALSAAEGADAVARPDAPRDRAPGEVAGGVGVRLPARRADPPSHARSPDRGRQLLVTVPRTMRMTARPGRGRVVGTIPATSRYYGTRTVAWIQEISADGRFGRLAVPYEAGERAGWVPLRGLAVQRTSVTVYVSRARHRVEVRRRGHLAFSVPAATGAPGSPTPRGRYFVTDRVAFPAGGYLGSFAFGLSGIQPRLPAGWSGGDQLAIHGTDDAASIGRSSSAGCVRVSEGALDRLRPLLNLGTPVIVGR